jgi:hypothetical protein
MRTKIRHVITLLLISSPLLAQSKRLWVLNSAGEIVEYDPATFSPKQHVKLPPEAAKLPAGISVNGQGQILFAPTVSLPLSDSDTAKRHKVWLWNGHAPASIDQNVEHKEEERGSNQDVSESIPAPYLSSDGSHLFWFANEAHRLEREGVDLSTNNSFQAWQTDLEGKAREEITSSKLPDCRCPTGSCEESCPSFVIWVPDGGVENFFLTTQFIAGQTTTTYRTTTRYQHEGGKWTPTALPDPLRRVLDANSSGSVIVEAIPDTGCCGWSNQSNDQTQVIAEGQTRIVFDEQATYKNFDYDVSFYTANARLSPDASHIAMTIVATAQSNKPIQLSEQGQANPEESQRIRKSLLELPAVEVKTIDAAPHRVAYIPHAVVIGWLNDKELLILENHLLVAYNLGMSTRRKSTIRVEDAAHAFLR